MTNVLLQLFEDSAQSLLSAHVSLSGQWSIARRERRVELSIAPTDPAGFEVGATCEAWGILPRAGIWEDTCWEPYQWGVEEMCTAYFGLVRELVSPDARLRIQYHDGRPASVGLDLLGVNGWFMFDQAIMITGSSALLPHEVVLQNSHLPSRHPFTGLTPTLLRTHPWSRGG